MVQLFLKMPKFQKDLLLFFVQIAVIFIVLVKSQIIYAAEITLEDHTIKLEGEIVKGDLDKIKILSRNVIIYSIRLFSPGGNVQEAFRISDYMNENLISAHAPFILSNRPKDEPFNSCRMKGGPKDQKNCTCGSSCAFIWLLSSIRTGNTIGVHRPRFNYDDYANMNLDEAKNSYSKMINLVKDRLIDAQINPQIIDLVMNTSSGSIRFLTKNELKLINKYSPYLNELLIAKCNKFIDELSEYNAAADEQETLSQIVEEKCLYEPSASSKYCTDIWNKWLKLDRLRDFLEPKNYRKCERSELNDMRLKAQLMMKSQ